MLVVLSELMDSNDEKTTHGNTRSCIKRRSISGYFSNIIYELIMKHFGKHFQLLRKRTFLCHLP